jgi:hypothetical protein
MLYPLSATAQLPRHLVNVPFLLVKEVYMNPGKRGIGNLNATFGQMEKLRKGREM